MYFLFNSEVYCYLTYGSRNIYIIWQRHITIKRIVQHFKIKKDHKWIIKHFRYIKSTWIYSLSKYEQYCYLKYFPKMCTFFEKGIWPFRGFIQISKSNYIHKLMIKMFKINKEYIDLFVIKFWTILFPENFPKNMHIIW